MVVEAPVGADSETVSTIVRGHDVTDPGVLGVTCKQPEEAALAANVTREPTTWEAEFDHLMSELKSLAHTREP